MRGPLLTFWLLALVACEGVLSPLPVEPPPEPPPDTSSVPTPVDLFGTWRLVELKPWGLPLLVDTTTYTGEDGITRFSSYVIDSARMELGDERTFGVYQASRTRIVPGSPTWVPRAWVIDHGGKYIYAPPIVSFEACWPNTRCFLQQGRGEASVDTVRVSGKVRRADIEGFSEAEFVWERFTRCIALASISTVRGCDNA